MNLWDYIFGSLAFLGFAVWVLSLIPPILHDLHRIWSRLVSGSTPTTAKVTVEEMFTTPYAATRNASQQLRRKGGKP